MISKRANVFYLEHVRVMQKDERVVYLTESKDGIDQFVSIPDKNTAFVLLGKGTSITDAAARKLAESNVVVGFCGSGGSPLFAEIDLAFLLPQDEYRPPVHAQRWFTLWVDEAMRVEMGRMFLRHRAALGEVMYQKLGMQVPNRIFDEFASSLDRCTTTTELLSAEARFAKELYRLLALAFGVQDFAREPGAKQKETPRQRVNSFLDHGNYLAYGYAAVALHGMGIPYFLPVLHGKTRRGALVFDVADLFKDWLVMPAAFRCGSGGVKDGVFRAQVIELALKHDVLDHVMTFISELPEKIKKKQGLAGEVSN
ncbi:type I-F CRISPR-associated endonuclease Cas1f [Thiomonas sp. FB-Cd]|uniref:type I-F CRISPR-associated endonuclease Cas1f n=1 Tax=Thiomonas sp. FB-Cd TaxID=1158292 RepID=UPI0018CC6D13|nr:type I-F CRISPR-associated endonuclease Cas1f [Thiomonas sp. FB-Cd]